MKSRVVLVATVALVACGCRPPGGGHHHDAAPDGEPDSGPVSCTPGDVDCTGNQARMCNETGDGWVSTTTCEGATPVCLDGRGCVVCAPLQRDCQGDTPRECAADGSTWTTQAPCNTAAGQVCQYGQCTDPCAAMAESNSYVGCEYVAVDLPNAQQASGLSPRDAQFSVVVSNTHESATAHVEVFRGSDETTAIISRDVPPNDISVLDINPTVEPAESNVEGTGVFADRAYYIRSNVPVTAYQFNPLNNTEAAYSNDASLLLPLTGLDRDYIVATGDGLIGGDSGNPSITYDWGAFVTVVAVEDGTEVTVTPTKAILGGGDIPAGTAAVTRTLNRFDVLNIESEPSDGEELVPGDANLSGSRVHATNHPVAVFSGNVATVMPLGPDTRCCADHLEEQMIPLSAFGKRFVVARGIPRRYSSPDPEAEPEYYRITGGNVPSGQEAIHITYIPSAPEGAPSQLTEGESVQFRSSTHFIVDADGPVLLTSYFVSSFITAPELDNPLNARMCTGDGQCGGLPYAAVCYMEGGVGQCVPIGDPSMIVIPPVEQYRSSYVFLTPLDYAHDAVSVIAPTSAAVYLDGSLLTGASLIGSVGGTDYGVYRTEIGDATHRITTDGGAEVGLIVYGMDKDVSYGYPGGLDLEAINPIE